MSHALITGGAGFIGSHLVELLLTEGWRVTVVDNFDPFYDPAIKWRHLAACLPHSGFALIQTDIRHIDVIRARISTTVDVIVHLAAKAGVRPSIEDPLAYTETNVAGTQAMLELARLLSVKQFVFASSSSVYGINPRVPWREDDHGLRPISPYAGTKVSGELLGHVYSYLYGIRFLALRLFTVYGPRQRPDLAIHKFARTMLSGQPIPIYGDGTMRRDFTFIGDIIRGMRAAMEYDETPYEIVNLGHHRTISVNEMIAELERALGEKAIMAYHAAQSCDPPQTYADIGKAGHLLGYHPTMPFPEGMAHFIAWLTEEIGVRR